MSAIIPEYLKSGAPLLANLVLPNYAKQATRS